MKTIRRIGLGLGVSLLAVALASGASAAGKGTLLVASLILGWFEWRAWKRRAPAALGRR